MWMSNNANMQKFSKVWKMANLVVDGKWKAYPWIFFSFIFSLIEAKIREEMKGEVQCPVRLTLRTENWVEIIS